MKVFADRSHYDPNVRYSLNVILKALWNERDSAERHKVYGTWVDLFSFEPEISQADFCLLTYQWQHYVDQGKLAEAKAEVEAARRHAKSIVVFSAGDSPANLPFEDVILFESAGYRSTPRLRYHSAVPSSISDLLWDYCEGKLQLRDKGTEPVIGFCGQASTSLTQTVFRWLRLKKRQWDYRRGHLRWEPPPFETTTFRRRVLHQFENQTGVRTNYLLRSRYWAGVLHEKRPLSSAKADFVNNVLGSDYTVCMRGGGNFSIRFYETICLGRIPIFIDTDCILPFADEINYREIFPWIDVKDLPHAAEMVRQFHAKLTNEDFHALQKTCRFLWARHLTVNGFFTDFVRKMEKMI